MHSHFVGFVMLRLSIVVTDYCQRLLQADFIAHCKTVKEWNTHLYSFDMPKTSNFMAKTNIELYIFATSACDFQSPTTRFLTNFS